MKVSREAVNKYIFFKKSSPEHRKNVEVKNCY